MAKTRKLAAIAAVAALIIGVLSGCAEKQTTKIWTDEDIRGFFKTETAGYKGDNFEGGIKTDYTLYKNQESYESNYNYLSYYLFGSAEEAKRVFDELALKAAESGWTIEDDQISLSKEGEYDGEKRRVYDLFYLSGNLIIFYDYGCEGNDEEIVALYYKEINEMTEWIEATFDAGK